MVRTKGKKIVTNDNGPVLPGILGRLVPAGLPPKERFLATLAASTMLSRMQYSQALGTSYSGDRNLYETLGYPKDLTFSHYWARYQRQDIAARVVEAAASATWRRFPMVTDDESKKVQSIFEKRWNELTRMRKLWHYMRRVDKVSGIGQYGVLLLGFNDVKQISDLQNPVTGAKDLLYVKPFNEDNAEISRWDDDLSSERYGLPSHYRLKSIDGNRALMFSLADVHYSRIVHIAEDLTEDEVYGTPRLRSVYNRLQDLELIAGGSAEMFWRGAFPGLAFEMDPEAEVSSAVISEMQDDIEDFVHQLKRYVRLQGVKVNNLAMQVADPRGHVDVLIGMIAAAKGFPKRILVGSEKGELSSAQDERQWNRQIDGRRKDFAENQIVRPFVDRLILSGVMPPPQNNSYNVVWPDDIPDERGGAEIAKLKMEASEKYINMGISQLMPREIFLSRILGFDRHEVEDWLERIDRQEDEFITVEDREIDDDDNKEVEVDNENGE